MKRLILAILIGIALTAECSAAKVLDTDRAALGGIAIGSKIDYVRGIYGEPGKIKQSGDGVIDWYYGDTFQIRFVDGRATFVCSNGNNGLNTPDDVGVGMKKKQIKKTFGRPAERAEFGGREIYVYQGRGDWQMIFVVRDGFITEIRLTTLKEGIN